MEHITNKKINCAAKADAVALGNFDGLHRGHQQLICAAKEIGKAAVFSFLPHPSSVLGHKLFKTVITSDEKEYLLEKMGVELFIEYPFDEQVADMSPESFVEELLVGWLGCKAVVIGEDYRFGQRGRGDCEMMRALGKSFGFEVIIIPFLMEGGSKISSTRVREAVAEKKFDAAGNLMGHPYFVMGEVVYGNSLGRGMGIPTANIVPTDAKLLPPLGVYRTDVRLNGINYVGMTNVGTRPTVDKNENSETVVVETFILGFDGDLYGRTISVEFGTWIRDERKFQSLDGLRDQIAYDIEITKSI